MGGCLILIALIIRGRGRRKDKGICVGNSKVGGGAIVDEEAEDFGGRIEG